jgi:hypothetical protein
MELSYQGDQVFSGAPRFSMAVSRRHTNEEHSMGNLSFGSRCDANVVLEHNINTGRKWGQLGREWRAHVFAGWELRRRVHWNSRTRR